MNLRDQVMVKAVSAFEGVGFMSWHARVLRELSVRPQTIREISRRTGLFHYQIHGVLQDLLALQLIEYTRAGIQISDDWVVLVQLVDCCEGRVGRHSYDWEAAFDIALPRVMSLKKKFDFDG